ncbi:MAG: alpha/beta hydrolase [Gammaproteobacteria bacterium]|nr:alpha/beta hydrolase [Gammaproteobacteria bacterium]
MTFAAALFLAYLGACALLWATQDGLVFHPRSLADPPTHPAAVIAEIERSDAVLRGWVVNGDQAGPVIVYFGGNAEEVSVNIGWFADRRATTVLFNYRGYGDSTGKPSERHLVEDAVAVAEWSREQFPDRPLVLFGSSLGTGVASLAAAHAEADAAILVSPYRGIDRVAQKHFRVFPVRWMLRHPFRAEAVVAEMPPTLAIASSVDGVIPFAESEAMVQAMRAVEGGSPVEFRTVDVPHGAFPYAPDFWQAVDDYLAGVTQA